MSKRRKVVMEEYKSCDFVVFKTYTNVVEYDPIRIMLTDMVMSWYTDLTDIVFEYATHGEKVENKIKKIKHINDEIFFLYVRDDATLGIRNSERVEIHKDASEDAMTTCIKHTKLYKVLCSIHGYFSNGVVSELISKEIIQTIRTLGVKVNGYNPLNKTSPYNKIVSISVAGYSYNDEYENEHKYDDFDRLIAKLLYRYCYIAPKAFFECGVENWIH